MKRLMVLTGWRLLSLLTALSIFGKPLISPDGKLLYFGSNDNSLYCIATTDGKLQWKYTTNDALWCSAPALSLNGSAVYQQPVRAALTDLMLNVCVCDGDEKI